MMFAVSSPTILPVATTRVVRLRVSAAAAAVAAPPATMYDLLSVPHSAGSDEIRAAYRRQALRWHPDAFRSARGGDDARRFAERFMAVREAYEVLSDSARRRDYDLSLSGDRWAGAAFREGRGRRRRNPGFGFGNWEAQLDGLRRRSDEAEGDAEGTWGDRVRRSRYREERSV